MKLWDKGYTLDETIEEYTVGDDPQLDLELLPYDCRASIAHARVLEKAGVLTAKERVKLVQALEELMAQAERGELTIRREDEDGHTAIEARLIEKLGDLGKKIHTARSRNDQVAVALRMYMKARLDETSALIDALAGVLRHRIDVDGKVPMPGYSHMRRAMPSSVGLWLGAFAESMDDNHSLLGTVHGWIDQNPLGSGAGYGIPVFRLDREHSARELGFASVQRNPIYVQNSRGKFEATVVGTLVNVMADLDRLASDLILFTMEEFGFFSLPREICTGSSIMPQKLNPDVLEILRAKHHEVLANEFLIRNLTSHLISGYHRDFQRTKKPLIESFRLTESSLHVMTHVMESFTVNPAACERGCTQELYATERVYELVREGVPFRDAYKKIAAELFPNEK